MLSRSGHSPVLSRALPRKTSQRLACRCGGQCDGFLIALCFRVWPDEHVEIQRSKQDDK